MYDAHLRWSGTSLEEADVEALCVGVRGVHTAARTAAYVTPPAPMIAMSSTSCAAYMTLKSLQDSLIVAGSFV